MAYDARPLQRALIRAGDLAALGDDLRPSDDGVFGIYTRAAMQRFQARHGMEQTAFPDAPTAIALGLGPSVAVPHTPPPHKRREPSIIDKIGTMVLVSNLLKGKTMTKDQIEGIVRLAMGLIAGYFATKGWGDQSLWDWITAGAMTALPAGWSWWSNRPKVIVSLADKAKMNNS